MIRLELEITPTWWSDPELRKKLAPQTTAIALSSERCRRLKVEPDGLFVVCRFGPRDTWLDACMMAEDIQNQLNQLAVR